MGQGWSSCSSGGGGCGVIQLGEGALSSVRIDAINSASGGYSTVFGTKNTASGYISTIGGGDNNTASCNQSTIGGGSSNTASGYISTIGGGEKNTASK
jgi:hypothetical protein